MYRAEGDRDGEARIGASVGHAYFVQGQPRKGLEYAHALIRSLQDEGLTSGLGWLYDSTGRMHWLAGEYREQLEMAERAAAIARQTGDDALLKHATAQQKHAALFLGTDSSGFGDDARLEAVPDVFEMIVLGRYPLPSSRAFVEQALLRAKERDVALDTVLFGSLLGIIYFLLGDWKRARQHIEGALRFDESLGTPTTNQGPRMDLGLLCLCEGDWAEASRLLTEARDAASTVGDLFALRATEDRLALLDLLQGRPEAAIARLTPLLDRPGFEEVQVTGSLPTLAWAYLDAGDVSRAHHVVDDAVRRATAQGNRLDLLRSLMSRGKIEAAEGQRQRAEATFEEALSFARNLPCPYLEAQTLYSAAVLTELPEDREGARKRLEAALDIFKELGAAVDVSVTEQALSSLAIIQSSTGGSQ